MVDQEKYDAVVEDVAQGLVRFTLALGKCKSRAEAAKEFRGLEEIARESAEIYEAMARGSGEPS